MTLAPTSLPTLYSVNGLHPDQVRADDRRSLPGGGDEIPLVGSELNEAAPGTDEMALVPFHEGPAPSWGMAAPNSPGGVFYSEVPGLIIQTTEFINVRFVEDEALNAVRPSKSSMPVPIVER